MSETEGVSRRVAVAALGIAATAAFAGAPRVSAQDAECPARPAGGGSSAQPAFRRLRFMNASGKEVTQLKIAYGASAAVAVVNTLADKMPAFLDFANSTSGANASPAITDKVTLTWTIDLGGGPVASYTVTFDTSGMGTQIDEAIVFIVGTSNTAATAQAYVKASARHQTDDQVKFAVLAGTVVVTVT